MEKDPNILEYEEMATVLRDKMIELRDQIEMNVKMRTRFNNCLTAMLLIKEAYPHIFEECVTKEMLNTICEEKVS